MLEGGTESCKKIYTKYVIMYQILKKQKKSFNVIKF